MFTECSEFMLNLKALTIIKVSSTPFIWWKIEKYVLAMIQTNVKCENK